MPEFRTVSERDAQAYFRGRGYADVAEYEQFLATLSSGDLGEVRPEDDETEPALKRRLTLAAHRQGKQVQYSKRAPEGSIVFRIT